MCASRARRLSGRSVRGDAGLLEERTRISPAGSDPSEYRSVVDEVVLSVDGDDGLALKVSRESSDEAVGGPTPILRR